MTQLVIPNLEDKDVKVLKVLLDRMGISYSKHELDETDDSESLVIAKSRAGDPVANSTEQNRIRKELGLQ